MTECTQSRASSPLEVTFGSDEGEEQGAPENDSPLVLNRETNILLIEQDGYLI